jgi:hypothetical protein
MSNTSLNRPVASMNVGELVELIRQTIHEEFVELLGAEPEKALTPTPPPIRDINTVIGRMQATGKYNKKFLVSLRKGMERSRAFKSTNTKSVS